ncbi:uncharacterized protein LOC130665896 [Microplitis mediator]|uniref:uncharacterized protein LOC130665896 n=1 Tax=Microplitis mediator TaxID=375433 RepID=UPI002553DCBE|nr:uncharacterized protein LOC130665896 [Microplitis mediator]
MGNPASPAIANVVMNYVIGQILRLSPFEIPFIKLYVDDTIAAVPKKEVENVLRLFNSFDDDIQFTLEIEKDNRISFLDILIERRDGCLVTDWFIKPISSGRLLNYDSIHPRSQKIGMITGLLDRMVRLSNEEHHEKNYDIIRSLLLKNGYSKSFIDAILEKFKQEVENRLKNPIRTRNTIKYCRFPYIVGLSHDINRCFIGTTVRLAFYNLLKISSVYTKLKDPIKKEQQSCIVYKIPCSCDFCYIGQTKQYLESRIKQHVNDCKEHNYLKDNKTALASHHFDNQHTFSFDKVIILDKEGNWLKRNISEMIHIKVNDTVNKRTDTNNLSILYNDILNDYNSVIK